MARPSKAFLAAQRQAKRTARLTARVEALDGTLVEVKPGRRKFHNTPTIYKGERYDSIGEAEYAAKLDARVASGELIDWERQKVVVLVDAPTARARITMKVDFWVLPATSEFGHFVEYKGSAATETPVFKLKVRLWKQNVPHELRVAYKTGEERVIATGNECFAYRDALARANVPAAD